MPKAIQFCVLIGLYLLAPIISPWLSKVGKRELELYLAIWGLTLLYPVLRQYLDIEDGLDGILYYFCGWAGFFLFGYYLKVYGKHINFTYVVIGACVSFFVPLLVKRYGLFDGANEVYTLMSLPGFCMTLFWFLLIRRCFHRLSRVHGCSDAMNRFLHKASYLTFGVYLSHILCMREIVWRLDFVQSIVSYPIQTIISWSLTLLLSFIGCYIISKVPKVSKYLLG